jgi:hypothetical protein
MIEMAILEDLAQGNFKLTKHAKIRMLDRTITMSDIFNVARTGVCTKETDGKYKVVGSDCSEEDVTLICVYDEGTLIITVF